ncbi:hypothetical protein cand_003440 [Cryptosporidium andersoni]|uniref:Uncharacterized protein n=1 Tax=Cryptosporidium andersoni TaxID=117008 RepID=A0A1J4MGX7_9CRYT|nr:hypothetical protein cand_003440 [Cryptosporidium andersoni]
MKKIIAIFSIFEILAFITIYYTQIINLRLNFGSKYKDKDIDNFNFINNNKIYNDWMSSDHLLSFLNYSNYNNKYFLKLCDIYWYNYIQDNLKIFKNIYNNKSPTELVDNVLNFVNKSMITQNTLIRLRLKIKYKPIIDIGQNKNIIYSLKPEIYCVKDHRIKPNKIKFRDIKHTIKYIYETIYIINSYYSSIHENHINNNKENIYTKNLDILLHYDDCPQIWHSIDKNPYIEKCITSSDLSIKIRNLLKNEISNNFYNNDKSSLFLFNNSINIFNLSNYNDNLDINKYCNYIQIFVDNFLININMNNTNFIHPCIGYIKCNIPCNKIKVINIKNKSILKIYEHIFNSLQCICTYNNNYNNPPGLLLSISSNNKYTWDIAAIPYVNHLDNNEKLARSYAINNLLKNNNIINKYFDLIKSQWDKKKNEIFFIGRYTDKSRIDISCWLYNEIKNNSKIESNVYIVDSNKISCKKYSRDLQKKLLCNSDYICREEIIYFEKWLKLLNQSKISLDLPGVGPWSTRLRILLLSGSIILQSERSIRSHQFYDLPLKKLGLILGFSNENEFFKNVYQIINNPEIYSKVSQILKTFAIHCLSEDGIKNYFFNLINELVNWEISKINENSINEENLFNENEILINIHNDRLVKQQLNKCLM